MAKVHILQQSDLNTYQVTVHTPTPIGNNAAGISWKVAIVNSGLARTSMAVGNGPGQIAQSEANQVTSGDMIESSGLWGDDPNWTPAERQADLTLRAQQMADETLARYQSLLKYFGATVT